MPRTYPMPTPDPDVRYANPRIVTVGTSGQPLEVVSVMGTATQVRPVGDTSCMPHWVETNRLIPATRLY